MNSLIIDVKRSADQDKWIDQNLTAVNGILNLTDAEMSVVSCFVRLNPEIAGEEMNRKQVAALLGLKSVKTLNPVISKLRKKGVFIPRQEKAGTFTYHPCVYTGKEVLSEIRIRFKP